MDGMNARGLVVGSGQIVDAGGGPEVPSRISRGQRALGRTAVLVAGSSLLAPVLLDLSPTAYRFGWLLAIYTIVSAWPIARGALRGTVDLFDLPVWTTVEQWLRMGPLSVLPVVDPDWMGPLLAGDASWLNLALLYCLLSTPFLWLGYRSRFATTLGNNWHRLARAGGTGQFVSGSVPALLVLYAVVLVSRFYLINTGAFGYLASEEARGEITAFQQMFHFLDLGGVVVLVALWLYRELHARARGSVTGLFAAVFVVEFVSRMVYGSKGAVAFAFLALAIVDYRLRRRLLLFVPAGAIVLLFIIPINFAYRAAILDRSVDNTSLASIGATLSTLTQGKLASAEAVGQTLLSGGTTLMTNTAHLLSFAAVVKYVEDTGEFVYGEEWLKLPAILLVPRGLWPDKPKYRFTGVWMTQEVIGYQDATSATSISMQGDFYLNFGLVGVLLGMYMIGVVQRILYLRYGRNDDVRSLLGYPFVLLLVGPALTVEGLIGVIRLLLFLFLVSRFVFRRALPQP